MKAKSSCQSLMHTFVICAYKESPYLEECIRSVLYQSVPANVLIATSTPNAYILGLAEKYKIPVRVREGESGITQDWNFALQQADTPFVTLAHQDDVYTREYTRNLLAYVKQAKDPLLFFTDYAEIRGEEIVEKSRLLNIKRLMLLPLRHRHSWSSRRVRRMTLSLGTAICCPSVAYNVAALPSPVFADHFKAACDWEAWEKISRLEGSFVYCSKVLMYHRIHPGSETTRQLEAQARYKEEFQIYRKFWPAPVAALLERLYRKAEKSNTV